MSRDLFIYYRVPVEHTALMQQSVAAMQTVLRAQWPVSAALKRRTELKDGCETWMEIYGNTPEDFLAALNLAVQEAQLQSLTIGERHVEAFVDVAPCA